MHILFAKFSGAMFIQGAMFIPDSRVDYSAWTIEAVWPLINSDSILYLTKYLLLIFIAC